METNEPFVGILMLDTAFPRPVGDIGNPKTFSFPTRPKIVQGAFPAEIVRDDPSQWLEPFVEATRELIAEGASVITTSCGFLAPFQKALQRETERPVLTSSLFLYRAIADGLPAVQRPGILTIDRDALTDRHLKAAGIPNDAIVMGMPSESHFKQAILSNSPDLDTDQARKEHAIAAARMQGDHADLGAILLECTNMPPYADVIATATGLPVISILDGINAFWQHVNGDDEEAQDEGAA